MTTPDPIAYGIDSSPGWVSTVRRSMLVLLTVFACGFGCWWGLLRSTEAQVGINVSREESAILDLPPDARNVSYRLGGAMDPRPATYEFDTSEEAFVAWAKEKGAVLEEGETLIVRFDDSKVTVQRALYFARRTGPDSGWHVVYDLNTGRAYYAANSR